MKSLKTLTALGCSALMLVGCSNPKVIDGHTYKPYGLLNAQAEHDPAISYKMNVGDLILGALLVETIIVPIYVFGFNIQEPVGPK